jgi:hypothetical protein
MRRILRVYGVLVVSLVALFVSGVSIGRLTSPKPSLPASSGADAATEPQSWVAIASRGLVRDLGLDETQEREMVQHLEPVAAALYRDQERALFQMHLRLLGLHDTLAKDAGLDESQLRRLAVSRAKLKGLIIDKFPRMVRANPTLEVEAELP